MGDEVSSVLRDGILGFVVLGSALPPVTKVSGSVTPRARQVLLML
jgi:hypothetical protein